MIYIISVLRLRSMYFLWENVSTYINFANYDEMIKWMIIVL